MIAGRYTYPRHQGKRPRPRRLCGEPCTTPASRSRPSSRGTGGDAEDSFQGNTVPWNCAGCWPGTACPFARGHRPRQYAFRVNGSIPRTLAGIGTLTWLGHNQGFIWPSSGVHAAIWTPASGFQTSKARVRQARYWAALIRCRRGWLCRWMGPWADTITGKLRRRPGRLEPLQAPLPLAGRLTRVLRPGRSAPVVR
jgi:hypothetical protein